MLYDGDTFEAEGRTFRVTFPHDDTMGAPWEEHDFHGPVSDWTRRDKKPGEMVLNQDRFSKRFYDFAESVRLARRDGWGGEGRTKGERAHNAAMADFKRLSAWCNDEWSWIGVQIELLDRDGDGTGQTASVWGVESDAGDYLEELARELVSEIEFPRRVA